MLACVGLYGLLTQLVTRRTNEIGIRLALGAERRHIAGLVLRETARLVVPWVLAGLAAAVATSRVAERLLFGITPTDPVALVAAPVCLAVIALAATCVPAYRAATLSPLTALRHE